MRRRPEYEQLWVALKITPDKVASVEAVCSRLESYKAAYEKVERDTGVPWVIVGILHSLESSLNFNTHLHNGDSLKKRTIRVPAGRPLKGQPPFNWFDSAADAIKMKSPEIIEHWGFAECLWFLERYNGWGYMTGRGQETTPPQRSPYLWSFTNLYEKGKYVSDGRFDKNARSAQVGAGAILHAAAKKGWIKFAKPKKTSPKEEPQPRAVLQRVLRNGMKGDDVSYVQQILVELDVPNIFVDGDFGPITETAVKVFQMAVGISADGVVGPVTWKKLHSVDKIEKVKKPTTAPPAKIRSTVAKFAEKNAKKGRRHAPGNWIDVHILDPMRPPMVALGQLGASQKDSYFQWCACWVLYNLRQKGIRVPDRYKGFWATLALVESWKHLGKDIGGWKKSGAKVGDVVCFDWNGNGFLQHIGIVIGFSGSTVIVAEGNTSRVEKVRYRKPHLIGGYVCLDKLYERFA